MSLDIIIVTSSSGRGRGRGRGRRRRRRRRRRGRRRRRRRRGGGGGGTTAIGCQTTEVGITGCHVTLQRLKHRHMKMNIPMDKHCIKHLLLRQHLPEALLSGLASAVLSGSRACSMILLHLSCMFILA